METTRASALVAVVAGAVVVGVVVAFVSEPGAGALPPPCASPSLRDGQLVCDVDAAGHGDVDGAAIGERAWLVGQKLDLNTTTARSLERISGIGPSLAAKIIAARAARGRFTSIDELDDVDGVGPKMLAKLSAVVEVR